MKGVGSIMRAMLRGGVRRRGGTSSSCCWTAKRGERMAAEVDVVIGEVVRLTLGEKAAVRASVAVSAAS